MPMFLKCEICFQRSVHLVQYGLKSVCLDCVAMNEPTPYDRLHYFEDEDLFSEDARDDDASQGEYEREEDE